MVEQRNLNCELRPELTQLVQLLHNEKMSPDLLPYQEALVHTVSKAITSQERRLQSNQSTDPDDRFYANILKMEVERTKFVLKSYLRQRIAKIEKYLLWVVEKDQSALLSNAEMAFAFSLYESRKTHLQENLFDKIPKKLNFMAQDTLPDQYIPIPNTNEMVFARVLTDFKDSFPVMPHILVALQKDNIYFLPYHGIQDLIRKGQVELV